MQTFATSRRWNEDRNKKQVKDGGGGGAVRKREGEDADRRWGDKKMEESRLAKFQIEKRFLRLEKWQKTMRALVSKGGAGTF